MIFKTMIILRQKHVCMYIYIHIWTSFLGKTHISKKTHLYVSCLDFCKLSPQTVEFFQIFHPNQGATCSTSTTSRVAGAQPYASWGEHRSGGEMGVSWVYPPQPGSQPPPALWTNFSRESSPKPSFVTVTGQPTLCPEIAGLDKGLLTIGFN